MCRTCCVCRFTWNIFGTVLSLNAAPRCCARKINTLDSQVIGSFFKLGLHDKALPCIGLTFSRLVAHAADHQTAPSMGDVVTDWTSLFVDVGFSTSQLALILSGASWLSNQLGCLCSMITGPSRPGIANWLRQVRAGETTWTIFTH